MEISSSDIANASANDALRKSQDQAALIEWLAERVTALESFLVVDSIERPELPSERHQREGREMLARFRKEGWPKPGLWSRLNDGGK